MSTVPGVLHDPVAGQSRRVQVVGEPDGLLITGDATERRVAAARLSLAGGGWDGRQVHLTWIEDGHTFSLSLDLAGVQTLAAASPALAVSVEPLLQAGRRQERRGRRTLPLLAFVFGVVPLALLVGLYLMREPLIDAVLERLPPSVDVEIGNLVHTQVSSTGRMVESGPALDAIRTLGQRLAAADPHPSFEFRFYVLRDATLNAFAAPGGVIVVHTGLIDAAESPDEVAGVLAHEIVHVVNRHSMRQMIFQTGLAGALQLFVGSPEGAAALLTGAAQDLTSLSFGRDQEREADRRGLDLLQRAKLPPEGMIRFFDTLKNKEGAPPAFLSSHPPAGDRAAWLTEEVQKRGEWPVEPLAIDWAAVRAAARAAR